MKNKIEILGVFFDNVSKKDLCICFNKMLDDEGRGYIVTPNPEIVEHSMKDDKYRLFLNNATMCLADGIGIIYASKLLGKPIRERIPGVEAGEKMLCMLSKKKNHSVFFLGAKRGVAEKAANRLSKKYKGLKVSGVHHGYFNFNNEENNDVLKRINQSGATVLFVCMGYPRQEEWLAENIEKLNNIKVAITLGGSLDVYSGEVTRAPLIVRKVGLEWIWRAMTIPGHIRRLPALPMFMKHTIVSMLNKNK